MAGGDLGPQTLSVTSQGTVLVFRIREPPPAQQRLGLWLKVTCHGMHIGRPVSMAQVLVWGMGKAQSFGVPAQIPTEDT